MKTDDQIQQDVMAELRWDPQVSPVHALLGVSVKDGVVTLSGMLDNYSKKIAAEHAAQRVQGVKVVASDIEVRVGLFAQKNDSEIAETIKNALRWNSVFMEDKIDVKVDNGWVYLEGEVDWAYQRDAVKNILEFASGLSGYCAIFCGIYNNPRFYCKLIAVFC